MLEVGLAAKNKYNNRLNAEVKEKEEERKEKRCKLTANLDARTEKLCQRDRWVTY